MSFTAARSWTRFSFAAPFPVDARSMRFHVSSFKLHLSNIFVTGNWLALQSAVAASYHCEQNQCDLRLRILPVSLARARN